MVPEAFAVSVGGILFIGADLETVRESFRIRIFDNVIAAGVTMPTHKDVIVVSNLCRLRDLMGCIPLA